MNSTLFKNSKNKIIFIFYILLTNISSIFMRLCKNSSRISATAL